MVPPAFEMQYSPRLVDTMSDEIEVTLTMVPTTLSVAGSWSPRNLIISAATIWVRK